MASVQLRSRSAQERKQESTRRELQSKFDWILSEKYTLGEGRGEGRGAEGREKGAGREEGAGKQALGKLHPSIQKVESLESMQLVGMKSAIHELQDLVTPTSKPEIPPDYPRCQQTKEKTPQSFKFQHPLALPEQKDPPPRNKMKRQQNQTVQYYKEESAKLKAELGVEKTRNQEFVAVIKKLEHANCQLEKEVNLLLQRWQREHSSASKISELQQDFKQQLMINLELEELLLKQKLQIEKKQPPEQGKAEQSYKATIRELSHQLSENKKIADRETQALRAKIEEKEREIHQLKECVSKINETKPQEGMTSLQELQSPSNQVHCNFMERFANFSKEMEAKLSQHQIVSTNPSLQDTAMLGLDANRKHSQSQYSKGNCPSVEIPVLEVKGVQQHKGSSKTNRT